MSPGVVGAGFILAASICFSTEDIIIKLTAQDLTVWQISFGRYLLGAVGLLLLSRGSVRRLLGRQRGLLVLQAVLSTILIVLLVLSIQSLPLSLTLILFYLFPAFAALFSPWICQERVLVMEWGAVAVAVSGAGITLWSAEASAGFNWGYLLILAASVLTGICINLIRRLGATDTPATIYFYHCFIGAALCLPLLLLQDQPLVPAPLSLLGLMAIALLSLTGELAMNHSFKMVSSTRGSVLLMSEIIIGAGFGIIFLGEPAGARLFLGAGLILGCGVVLTLRPAGAGRRPPSSPRPRRLLRRPGARGSCPCAIQPEG